MKAYIHSGFPTDSVSVFVTQQAGPSTYHLWQSEGGDAWSLKELSSEATHDSPPTFHMPREMLEAIVAAAHDILPPSAATDRHLKDAVAVRDRLLALIEKREVTP